MITVFSSLKTAGSCELNETKLLISSQRNLPFREELNAMNMSVFKQISAEMTEERLLCISSASLLLKENNRGPITPLCE